MRVTRSADGVVDVDGSSAGRGAWLCRSAERGVLVVERCLDTAIARRAFARAWRHDVTVADRGAIAAAIALASSEADNARDDRSVDRDEHPDAH